MKREIIPLEQALAEPDLPPGREEILRLEAEVAAMPQVECPLRHIFAKGLYIRELTIPKNTVLVGYIHMQECVTTLAKGSILIAGGWEEETVHLKAPFTMACAAGTKKAGYALEDSVWIDAYANPDDERDIDVLEERITASSHQDYVARTKLLLEKP